MSFGTKECLLFIQPILKLGNQRLMSIHKQNPSSSPLQALVHALVGEWQTILKTNKSFTQVLILTLLDI